LEANIDVARNATVKIEYRFDLRVDGDDVKRGPCLNFLTVFEGPGGLVLENGLEITEVIRQGEAEKYHVEAGDGRLSLYCGSPYITLDPGVYNYVVKCVAKGDWRYSDGEAFGAFDITGPFSGLPIDRLNARVRLPEGVSASQFSAAVTGINADTPGYVSRNRGQELEVETSESLESEHTVFLNIVWPAEDFPRRSRWLQIMQQNPQLPIAVFAGTALLLVLGVMILRRLRRPAKSVDA
tara:strand:+ start:615 stop:1331 length:717 start_codon:yes stop_codon:yes gene_type:complete